MKHFRILFLLPLFCLLACPPLSAQVLQSEQQRDWALSAASGGVPSGDSGKKSEPKKFISDIWRDQKAIWSSPFQVNRKRWWKIAVPLAAATAGLIAVDEDAARWLPNTPDQIRWSKRVSTIGSIYTLGGLVGGGLIVGKVSHNPQLLHMGRSGAEAMVDAVIVSYALKLATGRERPDENDGKGRFWKGSDSFPSGHSMDTWAVATAVARSRNCPKWLAVTSYAIAATVSLSRWGAQRHFPSDIVVGGVIGGLIGNYVATRPVR